jgi:exopolysaccharide biosynthesis polyprenyl glycosylphosphotransferase
MPTPEAPPTERPRLELAEWRPAGVDIRSARPFLLTASSLKALARRILSVCTLLALDLGGLTLGLYAALALRQVYYGDGSLWGVPWAIEREWLPFLTLIAALVFWRAGLYASRERRAGVGRIWGSLALVALVTIAFAVGTGYEIRTFGLFPTAWVICSLAVSLFRSSYETLTRDVMRLAGIRRRAIVVGEGDRVGEVVRSLGSGRSGIDYEILGAIAPSATGIHLPLLGGLADTPTILERRPVDELILTDTGFEPEELLELVEHAHRSGVKVRVAPTTTELLLQRAEFVPGQGTPLFELRPPALAGVDWAVKRVFDVAGSLLVILAGLPLWLAIAAAIRLNSPGPVFYRDRRIGLGEREFGMLKFRTMYRDAAARQSALETANEASGPLFKIKHDPRVTRVGRFLRRFSIDEVPQVWNVLRGEMSLVGPRPLPLRDYQQLEDWHKKRYLVLPGMTGLWQVSGRIDLSFDELVRLDFHYLENWSIWLDVSILARTLPAVVARRGAY